MISLDLIPVAFGLAAAILWGIADFLAAKSSKRHTPEIALFWVSIISTFTYAIIFTLNSGDSSWNMQGVMYACGAGVFLELGLYTLYKGLSVGPVSIVSPVSSAYPVVTAIGLLVIFGESLTVAECLGILIVVIGVALASLTDGSSKKIRKTHLGVYFAVMTIFLWGAAYTLLAQAVTSIGWEKSTLVDLIFGFLTLLLLFIITARDKLKRSFSIIYIKDKYVVLTGLIQLAGGITFTIGLSQSNSNAVITAISATYPAIVILLALRYFGETKQTLPLVGACITIIGIVVLSLS